MKTVNRAWLMVCLMTEVAGADLAVVVTSMVVTRPRAEEAVTDREAAVMPRVVALTQEKAIPAPRRTSRRDCMIS